MNPKIRRDEQGFYLDINDFSDLYDVSKIAFYTLEEVDGDNIKVMFYNKNKKLLKPKKKKLTTKK